MALDKNRQDDSDAAHPLPAPPPYAVALAYIYRRAGTPAATTSLLRDYIQEFADRQGLVLDSVFVGVEGQTARLTVQDLLVHIAACSAHVVIVAGPAYAALQALRRRPGIQVLTLGDIQAMTGGSVTR